jgi:alkylhydroperoxidase family enzyme
MPGPRWREAKVFTEAERAALELVEQGTRIADAASGTCPQQLGLEFGYRVNAI